MRLKNYTRVFAFGCSMTHYPWPTWADIYGMQFPEYYNYGRGGAGNIFISNQIVEQSLRYNWNENDLVLIMWSDYTREDRYYDLGWQTPGNIWTQDYYDEKFVKKYACPKGYLIRDLAIIKLAESYMSNLPCDYKMFMMNDLDLSIYETDDKDITNIYDIPKYPSLLQSVGGKWPEIYCYNKENPIDYHPDPMMHYNFLEYAGMDPTAEMKSFAEVWQEKVDKYSTHDEVNYQQFFKEVDRL